MPPKQARRRQLGGAADGADVPRSATIVRWGETTALAAGGVPWGADGVVPRAAVLTAGLISDMGGIAWWAAAPAGERRTASELGVRGEVAVISALPRGEATAAGMPREMWRLPAEKPETVQPEPATAAEMVRASPPAAPTQARNGGQHRARGGGSGATNEVLMGAMLCMPLGFLAYHYAQSAIQTYQTRRQRHARRRR